MNKLTNKWEQPWRKLISMLIKIKLASSRVRLSSLQWRVASCGIEKAQNTEVRYSHFGGGMMRMEIIRERGGWSGVRDERCGGGVDSSRINTQRNKLRRDGDFSLVLLHFFFQYSPSPSKNYNLSSCAVVFILFFYFIISIFCVTMAPPMRANARTHAPPHKHARSFKPVIFFTGNQCARLTAVH